MHLIAASELSTPELCDLWGAVYEGYPYPNTYTPALLERIVHTGAIDLSASALLVESGGVAGLSFLGVRADRGWIGSFGIRAPFRGKGLSLALIEGQLQWAVRRRLFTVQLEVLAGNPVARHVYERAGFRLRREVAVLNAPSGSWPRAGVEGAVAVDRRRGLALLSHLHGSDLPTWQREEQSVAAADEAAFLAVNEEGALAYQVRPNVVRILDIAVAPGREEVAGALLGALHRAVPAVSVSLLNEPVGPLSAYLQTEGFGVVDRQAEMVYSSSGASPRRSFNA